MDQALEVTVDGRGRIRIPEALRRRLGLTAGMTLVVEETDDDGVILEPEKMHPGLVEDNGILVFDAKPLGDLDDAVARDREERDQKLTGSIDL